MAEKNIFLQPQYSLKKGKIHDYLRLEAAISLLNRFSILYHIVDSGKEDDTVSLLEVKVKERGSEIIIKPTTSDISRYCLKPSNHDFSIQEENRGNSSCLQFAVQYSGFEKYPLTKGLMLRSRRIYRLITKPNLEK